MSGLLPSSHSLFLFFFFFLCFHSTTATTDNSILESIILKKKSIKPSDKPTGRQSGSILGGETCFTNSECVSNVCTTLDTGSNTCPPDSFSCVCIASSCTAGSECESGESCVETSEGGICVSDNSRILPRPGALTLGRCSSTADCATLRDCFGLDENKNFVRCAAGSPCLCLPLDLDPCSEINSSADCETTGETCGEFTDTTNICMDPEAAASGNSDSPTSQNTTTPESTSQGTTTPVSTSKDPGTSSPGTGLTMEPCKLDSACASDRKCLQASDENGISPCEPSAVLCFCIPTTPLTCTSDSDCVPGETCFSIEAGSLCISERIAEQLEDSNTTSDSGSNDNTGSNASGSTGGSTPAEQFLNSVSIGSTEGGSTDSEIGKDDGTKEGDEIRREKVCIAATELAHLSSHELLYTDHVHASVLCDKYGSCATPGHIVHYNGSPMMMKTYCGLWTEGCEKKITPVNSPRWSRKLRISSKSPGLEYTAFAARYETNAEERLLQTAIRFGL